MKVEIDQKDIDKLIKKRVTQFNKEIRTLQAKLVRRDNRIVKMKREIEMLEASLMGTKEGEAKRIADLASCLVSELKRVKWIPGNYCWNCDEDNDNY